MRILHVNAYLAQKGGVETYLLSLLPLLRARGIDQQVVYERGDAALHPGAIQVHGIEDVGWSAQKKLRERLASVLQAERPDIVHVHNIQNVGALEASFAYGPTVLTSHDYRTICPASLMFYKRTQEICQRHCGPACITTTLAKHCLTPRPRYASYFYYRSRWMIGQADRYARVLTPSGSVKDRLIRAGFDGNDVEVIPYFCPVPPREAPRPIPEAPTITYIGRISDYKGYAYFIKALGLLPARFRGLLVGNMTESNERHIRTLAREAGCEDRLTLRPWAAREEIVGVMEATTVLIFPSLLPETLGIVGLEAFARGVPVVASDVGGVREWLVDGKNGRLVPPKSAERIRDAVLDITAAESTLMDFGRCGIQTINDKFLPAHHINRLTNVYENVLA